MNRYLNENLSKTNSFIEVYKEDAIKRAKEIDAKIKTSTQFIAIAGYILGLYLSLPMLIFISNFILFAAVLITLITGLEYSKNTFRVPTHKE